MVDIVVVTQIIAILVQVLDVYTHQQAQVEEEEVVVVIALICYVCLYLDYHWLSFYFQYSYKESYFNVSIDILH